MNIDLVADLPTEPGLYQFTGVGTHTPIEHAQTFRLTARGGWMDALDNASLGPSQLQTLGAHHRAGRLVRLVRELDPVLRDRGVILDARRAAMEIQECRAVQFEIGAASGRGDFLGAESSLWMLAQKRIEELHDFLAGRSS